MRDAAIAGCQELIGGGVSEDFDSGCEEVVVLKEVVGVKILIVWVGVKIMVVDVRKWWC